MLTHEAYAVSDGHRPAGRRKFLGVLAGGALASTSVRAETSPEPDSWPALSAQIFPDQVLHDGSGLLAIEAPYRAEDAAVVPVTLRTTLPAGDTRQVRAITLVVQANPSPVAATFTIGPDSGVARIATRIRVDEYTNVRAVAELTDGAFYAVSRYLKAAGGCSAPALKQTADAIPLGTLRFREYPTAEAGRHEAQVMVRHPNYSGMQMDQISRLYIPANFLVELRVWQDDRLLLTIASGISISENPAFRFSFQPNPAASQSKVFRVEATDSEGHHFSGTFPASASAM